MTRTYALHPTLTAARRRWLEHLDQVGTASRGSGPVGIQCMRLGWTEWAYQHSTTGEVIDYAEIKRRYPPTDEAYPGMLARADGWIDVGEMLTALGREVLATGIGRAA